MRSSQAEFLKPVHIAFRFSPILRNAGDVLFVPLIIAPEVPCPLCANSGHYRASAARRNWKGMLSPSFQARASSTILNGPAVAFRTRVNPPSRMTSVSFVSPACAPKPSPTSWSNDVGTQIIVEAL
jgi:hypothetical protein